MEKKLYRSRTNKTFSGVCGGLGEYLNMDPTLVRVLWVLISIFVAGFPGLIAYVVMAAVIPEAPEQPVGWQAAAPPSAAYPPQQGWQQPPPQDAWQAPPPPPSAAPAPPYTDYTQPAPPEAPPEAPPADAPASE